MRQAADSPTVPFPEFAEARTFAELDDQLGTYVHRAGIALDIEQIFRRTLQDRINELEREIAKFSARAINLERGTTDSRRELEALRAETATLRARLHDLTTRTQEAYDRSYAFAKESGEAKKGLIRHLWQAQQRGWVQAPGAYRPPLLAPAAESRASITIADESPGAPVKGLAQPAQRQPGVGKLASAPRSEPSFKDDTDRAYHRISRLDILGMEIAATRRENAGLTREHATRDRQRAELAARTEALERQHITIDGMLRNARNELEAAKSAAKSAAESFQRARENMFVALVEAQILKELNRRAKAALDEALAHGVNLNILLKIRKVNEATVALFTDTMDVVRRFPAVMTENGESIAALERDLGAAIDRFHFTFYSALANEPGWLIELMRRQGR